MLLDSFEKQLDLPASFVQFADGYWWRAKEVCQKDERFPCLWIFEANTAQVMGIVLLTVEPRQGHRLIADNTLRPIARRRVDPSQIGIRLGAGDKERASFVKSEKSLEIEVGTVHHIDRRGFRDHEIEHVDVVQFAVGNMYKARDIAAQVQQRMHFDCGLGAAKRCPWKQGQTEIYRGRIQRIYCVRQVQAQILFGIELASMGDKPLCKLGVDSPVSSFVGVGQGRALDRRPNTHVVQLGRLRRKAHFDIAQAFPVGQLRKRQGAKVFGTRKYANTMIPIVSRHQPVKSLPRKIIHDLRKQRLSGIHPALSIPMVDKVGILPDLYSNRGHSNFAVTYCVQ